MDLETELSAGFAPLDAATGQACRLAMQELWLAGRVLPVGARLMVRHVFRSGESKPMDVVYAFALPRDAAPRRFRVDRPPGTGKPWALAKRKVAPVLAARLRAQGVKVRDIAIKFGCSRAAIHNASRLRRRDGGH